MSELVFRLVRAYIRFAGFVKDRFARDLRGLGWASRRIRAPRVLDVHGRRMVFEPGLAGAYLRLLAGQWNEPETHRFLNQMIDAAGPGVSFIDVGASVGAMVIDLAGNARVRRVLAFEPHAATADVCRRSVELNGWQHVGIRAVAIGADAGSARFAFDDVRPSASRLDDGPSGSMVAVSTLDIEAAAVEPPTLLLIDVEGAEPAVIRGAKAFIERTAPVIVFEYNDLSRRHYDVAEVGKLLGPRYDIWRLRVDGMLDRNVSNAWNCVAIPRDTVYYEAVRPLIRAS